MAAILKIKDENGNWIEIPAIKGKDGKTPRKGVDYFTPTDKTEMVNAVLDALPVYEGEVSEA